MIRKSVRQKIRTQIVQEESNETSQKHEPKKKSTDSTIQSVPPHLSTPKLNEKGKNIITTTVTDPTNNTVPAPILTKKSLLHSPTNSIPSSEQTQNSNNFLQDNNNVLDNNLDEEEEDDDQNELGGGLKASKASHKAKKQPWSEEEDLLVRKLVEQYGPQKWTFIAQHIPGRIGKQCRERWHNHLNPHINKDPWSDEEEWVLFLCHKLKGNKWAEITALLPGRTDNSIKNHWNSSMKKRIPELLQRLLNIKKKNEVYYKISGVYKEIEQHILDQLLLQKEEDLEQQFVCDENQSPNNQVTQKQLQTNGNVKRKKKNQNLINPNESFECKNESEMNGFKELPQHVLFASTTTAEAVLKEQNQNKANGADNYNSQLVNNTSLNNPIKQIGEIEIEEEYDENDEENNCEKEEQKKSQFSSHQIAIQQMIQQGKSIKHYIQRNPDLTNTFMNMYNSKAEASDEETHIIHQEKDQGIQKKKRGRKPKAQQENISSEQLLNINSKNPCENLDQNYQYVTPQKVIRTNNGQVMRLPSSNIHVNPFEQIDKKKQEEKLAFKQYKQQLQQQQLNIQQSTQQQQPFPTNQSFFQMSSQHYPIPQSFNHSNGKENNQFLNSNNNFFTSPKCFTKYDSPSRMMDLHTPEDTPTMRKFMMQSNQKFLMSQGQQRYVQSPLLFSNHIFKNLDSSYKKYNNIDYNP